MTKKTQSDQTTLASTVTNFADLSPTTNQGDRIEGNSSGSSVKPSFGWNVYAEQINGRFAMVGFILLLGLELFTGQDFFTWLGLR